LHRCHQTFGGQQRACRFELPRREPVANDCVGRDFKRRDPVEETFLRRFEQRQIRFVIDYKDVGCRFFA
jgi:hypothetical protein